MIVEVDVIVDHCFWSCYMHLDRYRSILEELDRCGVLIWVNLIDVVTFMMDLINVTNF
jgi:hypothetical protein